MFTLPLFLGNYLFRLPLVDNLKIYDQFYDWNIRCCNEFYFCYLASIFQYNKIIMKFLHYTQQLILGSFLILSITIIVRATKGINPCYYKIYITSFNSQFRSHWSKYLYPDVAISMLFWESVFDYLMHNWYEALPFFANRIFEFIYFFDFVFHLPF